MAETLKFGPEWLVFELLFRELRMMISQTVC